MSCRIIYFKKYKTMKKKEILIILAILILGVTLNALETDAQCANLSENKVNYYKKLSYSDWKNTQEKQAKKIQIKINNMTKERFEKMKQMQLNYWENHF